MFKSCMEFVFWHHGTILLSLLNYPQNSSQLYLFSSFLIKLSNFQLSFFFKPLTSWCSVWKYQFSSFFNELVSFIYPFLCTYSLKHYSNPGLITISPYYYCYLLNLCSTHLTTATALIKRLKLKILPKKLKSNRSHLLPFSSHSLPCHLLTRLIFFI